MRVIAIGPQEEAALKTLREHAEANPVKLATIMRMTSGAVPPIGENQKHRLELPGGFRIVYSLEDQSKAMCRHASFSVAPATPGRFPSVEMVEFILPYLGFTDSDKMVWVEGHIAVNVVQPITDV